VEANSLTTLSSSKTNKKGRGKTCLFCAKYCANQCQVLR
jgi:hypothetical protein